MQCVKSMFQTQSWPVGLSHTKMCLSCKNKAVGCMTFMQKLTSWPDQSHAISL